MNKKRYAKRMAKRQIDWSNTTIPEAQPYYDVIQNTTCIQVPDIIQGPYVWPQSELLRTDMSEDQPGVPLIMDIGVLDMATCEPLTDVMVSLWHANATGSYSSFTALDPNLVFGDLLTSLNMTRADMEYGVTDIHTDDTTFLRGMYPTDSEGVMEMKTVFPGFYAGRSLHVHSQVYTDYTLFPNGTISSGYLVSTGQLYFDESLSAELMALEPYASHTQTPRVTNDIDQFFPGGLENGWNPVFDVIPADGVDPKNGMIAYITMGIDTNNIQNAPMNIKTPGE
ncbi:hypothetical protein N8I77_008670 [Diaporthe amygdali]|uniref:Intradiol ring-cleavage dioxygenases domain-containing protein n=1 Tax=Phomopsis amygdali TaxID=1214568 RepID=A0AAD9S9S5_PHOAM|nr:hypothetical protein N8I77_008670 [Diaporthe amygdali]